MNDHVLDNPAWSALNSEHVGFAIGSARAKRYRPGTVPFVACRKPVTEEVTELEPWIATGEAFFIIGDLPALPEGWQPEFELPCAQMVLTTPMPVARGEEGAKVVQLGPQDAEEMYQLINLVQPGYYNIDTHQLGTYFGIRHNGQLVAMAGERMRMAGFSELSAIATHPEHTGRGYAQQLISRLCNMHAASNVKSFLHVALTNERALRLYEHMGFAQRRVISFHKVKRLS